MRIWEDKELLERLEMRRDTKRSKSGRLTIDCYNLKVKEDRAYCSKGYRLSSAKDGSVFLLMVLRGVTCGVCKACKEFSGEA